MSMFNRKCEKCKNMVKCEECGCHINVYDAQKVILRNIFGDNFMDKYYCGRCRRKYNEIIVAFPNKYYANIEVNEEGNPIGYKKIK